MSKPLQVVEHDLPAYWASYLINGDASGIDSKEQYEADKFLAERNLPAPCDVKFSEGNYQRFQGLLTEVATYTFLI